MTTDQQHHLHLGGGVNYQQQPSRPISHVPVAQSSPKYGEVVGTVRPPITNTQPYVGYVPTVVNPSVIPSSQSYPDIVPVQPCNINLIRPALGTRPADSYITHTKID